MSKNSAVTAPSRRLADAVAALLRLPAALQRSLHPESEDAARMVEAELDVVRSNMRLLDFTLPLIGAVVVFVHKSWAPVPHMLAAFVAVVLACAANEMILLRRNPQQPDPIARTSSRAWITF